LQMPVVDLSVNRLFAAAPVASILQKIRDAGLHATKHMSASFGNASNKLGFAYIYIYIYMSRVAVCLYIQSCFGVARMWRAIVIERGRPFVCTMGMSKFSNQRKNARLYPAQETHKPRLWQDIIYSILL
jgi:hypothetical protein